MAQEDLVGRVMPHSLEAERSVLGSMLIDPDAVEIASEIVKEEDFYARQNGILYRTMLEMSRKGVAIDPVTLQAKLREKNLPPELYSDELIRELIAMVPSSANIKSYANIVAEKSLLRSMIRANEEIAGSCYAEQEEMETLLDKAERRIFEISQRRTASNFVPIRQIRPQCHGQDRPGFQNQGKCHRPFHRLHRSGQQDSRSAAGGFYPDRGTPLHGKNSTGPQHCRVSDSA